ncbi:zinc-binding dehydrogenase [Nocardiopsis lambiniae]|uniref:Zinc-binding dehydrogenase n=1 Tax=Nocardiopsis lambiniae TaxID=3075539 RepID=A0ABU2M9I4_9ACTN|nr:zinc-binding dehydrogenase [Nocardiopsis sp. DSM 44743]MDT0328820.1 zinc-binding dehydrogenase [Nocardiopsis sp. DSM 44743]
MRAIRVDRFGGPEVLVTREVPDPEIGPGTAEIAVEAANVMYLEVLVRSGWGLDYFPVAPPYTPGTGVAGTVTRVGPGVDPAWVGSRVVADTLEQNEAGAKLPVGGYAERAVVRADELVRVPEGVDPRHALALLYDGPTALSLARTAGYRTGQTVLVTAATGGAGSLSVQLARRAGARVIAAARGTAKLDLARRLGAHEAVDYSLPGWTDRVRELTGGLGVDTALDGAGASLGEAAFTTVAEGGRFISYGSAGGRLSEIEPARAREHKVQVFGLFDINKSEGEADALTEALDLARSGELVPHIGLTLPLEKADEAHRALEERRVLGKVLLTP